MALSSRSSLQMVGSLRKSRNSSCLLYTSILWADLGMFPTTSVQGGVRPVIVVSNNKANTYSSVTVSYTHLVCINVDGISLNGFALTLSFPVLRMEQ